MHKYTVLVYRSKQCYFTNLKYTDLKFVELKARIDVSFKLFD